MTENEAIKELSYDNTAYGGKCTEEVRRVAIHALSEIQEYRAIGTIEELQNLKEKNEPKHEMMNVNGGCICNNFEMDWDFMK